MFTFSNTGKAPLFFIRKGGEDRPVYTTFKKDSKLRIKPFRDSKKYLDSDEFRERYDLSKAEGTVLKSALRQDSVPEGPLKKEFYRIRRDLNQRLFSEIDLRGTEYEIVWKFPDKVKEWPGSAIYCGSSSSGKTFLVVSQIEEALKRSKAKRRTFVYISPELTIDTTLKKILNRKSLIKWFKGVDVSEDAFKESELGSVDQWWSQEILPQLENQPPGTMFILDDAPSAVVHRQLQRLLIKYLKTGRHKKYGVTSLQHNIRNGKWTSQSFSSVKNVVLFPRAGGKGKVVNFWNENFGIRLKQAHELVDIFGESGRWVNIHIWSPTVMFGPKYALFV